MTAPILVSAGKRLRAGIIAQHLQAAGKPPTVVTFTCGNAADALRAAGLDVLEVGPRGALAPTRWWTPEEIARAWPQHFDATPGHLPLPLMIRLAHALRGQHGELAPGGAYLVPSGSGETLIALRLAYPHLILAPLHSDAPAIDRGEAQHAPALQLPQLRPAAYQPDYEPGAPADDAKNENGGR